MVKYLEKYEWYENLCFKQNFIINNSFIHKSYVKVNFNFLNRIYNFYYVSTVCYFTEKIISYLCKIFNLRDIVEIKEIYHKENMNNRVEINNSKYNILNIIQNI